MDEMSALDYSFCGMGTEMLHRAYGAGAKTALEAVEREAGRLEGLLSRFVQDSDVSRINAAAGKRCVRVSPESFGIIKRAIEFSKLSSGAFDISVGPLIDLWDYKNAVSVPEDREVAKALALVDYSQITLDEKKMSVMLNKEGQSIDLGGIAKGYASDKFMEIFKGHGICSAFSNIGGNVSTLGTKPDLSSWRVGIRHPRKEGLMGAVETSGDAVVTSGDYERFFIGKDGKRYHHILSPFTGSPARTGIISATVISKSALDADALSTALFVAGLEKAAAILNASPWCEAVLADSDMKLYVTRGIKERFEPSEGLAICYI